MKPEDRLLLICLRQNFTADHIQAVNALANSITMDWERVALTAELHGVSGLIQRNLTLCQAEGLDIPEKAAQKLKLSAYKNAVMKERQKERLIRALSFLHDRNFGVMLIKGAALDCCVYKVDGVLSDDVDVIIRAKRDGISHEQLKEINIFLHNQGIEYEFFVHHDLDITGLLPIDFESIWEHATQEKYHEYPIYLMSTTDLLLSLCINSNRKRYFRLKSLCDISETVQAKQDVSWQQVAERARLFQCENIVYIALLVTSLTTGCNLPADWESHFDIHPLRRKVVNIAVNSLINHISFYPYPPSGITITNRSMHLSLLLPYIGYTRSQVIKKLSYVIRVPGD